MWYRFCYNCDHEWESPWNPRELCPKCKKRKWSSNSRRQVEAQAAVYRATRDGTLVKQPCSVCGTHKGVHAHHEDYTQPLKVVWLCQKHHAQRHAEMRRLGINPKRSAFSENRLIPRDMTPKVRDAHMRALYAAGIRF